jgi:hypothetical protein
MKQGRPLVLDASNAKIPGVVRVDVEGVAYFHVQSGQEGSVLGYNNGAGQFTPIAVYADRAAADKALASIKQQLCAPFNLLTWVLRTVVIVATIVVTLFVIGWVLQKIATPSAPPPAHAALSSGPATAAAPVTPAGVPVDADSAVGQQD